MTTSRSMWVAPTLFGYLSLAACGSAESGSEPAPTFAAPSFREATATAELSTWRFTPTLESASLGGASAADFDDDGRVDLLVMGAGADTLRLYRNQGGGEFEDVTEAMGLGNMPELSASGLFLDADGDNDLDLLVTFYSDTPVRYYENTGAEFRWREDAMPDNAQMSLSAACADLDADGLPEVHLTHWAGEPLISYGFFEPPQHAVLLGNRGGSFTDVGAAWGLDTRDFPFSFTSNFVDLDRDGRLDLVVASDYGNSRVVKQVDGGFVVSDQDLTDENGMGASVADFDNDGDMDWFVTSVWASQGESAEVATGNRLYENDGQGRLSDVSEQAGVRKGHWGWGACAADFNNDGWLDIFQVNGFGLDSRSEYAAFEADPSVLFMGQPDGRFLEMAAWAGMAGTGQGRGVACMDYDLDGDVDVLLTNADTGPRLFENTTDSHHGHLSLRLRSRSANTRAIGARVRVVTTEVTQTREIHCGNNFLSQDPYRLHVGLGSAGVADRVEVQWPSGQISILHDVPANTKLEVLEPQQP